MSTPVGSWIGWVSSSTPDDWVLCDGAAYDSVANTEFASLYAVIGTTWGGTGPDNFNVPDFTGQAPTGVGPSQLIIRYKATPTNGNYEKVSQQLELTTFQPTGHLYQIYNNAPYKVLPGLLTQDKVNKTDSTDTESLGDNPTSVDADSRTVFKYTFNITGSHTQTFSNTTNLGGFISNIQNQANSPVVTFSGVTLRFVDLPDGFSFSSNALTFPDDAAAVKDYVLTAEQVGASYNAVIRVFS